MAEPWPRRTPSGMPPRWLPWLRRPTADFRRRAPRGSAPPDYRRPVLPLRPIRYKPSTRVPVLMPREYQQIVYNIIFFLTFFAYNRYNKSSDFFFVSVCLVFFFLLLFDIGNRSLFASISRRFRTRHNNTRVSRFSLTDGVFISFFLHLVFAFIYQILISQCCYLSIF